MAVREQLIAKFDMFPQSVLEQEKNYLMSIMDLIEGAVTGFEKDYARIEVTHFSMWHTSIFNKENNQYEDSINCRIDLGLFEGDRMVLIHQMFFRQPGSIHLSWVRV